MKAEFLAADVEKITGVNRNRLEQWLSRGFIAPSIQAASGSGTRNRWSRADLYTIAIFKRLVESGLSRETVGKLLSAGALGDDLMKKINDALVINFRGLKEDIDAEIEKVAKS